MANYPFAWDDDLTSDTGNDTINPDVYAKINVDLNRVEQTNKFDRKYLRDTVEYDLSWDDDLGMGMPSADCSTA
jgi:hypothetical protein